MRGVRWDQKTEYRERRPWPQGMRFTDARTERIIDRRRPPKPVAQAYGSSGAMCVGVRFAEGELSERADSGALRPARNH
jgi:hypothetical protein